MLKPFADVIDSKCFKYSADEYAIVAKRAAEGADAIF